MYGNHDLLHPADEQDDLYREFAGCMNPVAGWFVAVEAFRTGYHQCCRTSVRICLGVVTMSVMMVTWAITPGHGGRRG